MAATAAQCTEAVQTALAMLRDADPTQWDIADQAEFLATGHAMLNTMQAVQHEVTAAFDASGGARQLGARTTSSWLQKTLRLTGPQAGSMVNTARVLRDKLPLTAHVFKQGVISLEHVYAIRKGHNRLGTFIEAAETEVCDFATGHDVRMTRLMINRLIDQYDPAAADDEAEDEREHRGFHLSQTSGGWWAVDGLLDPSTGARLNAAMQVFSEPCGEDDPRSPKQRRCDALGEIADRALSQVDRVSGSSAVTITVTPDQLHGGDGVCWPEALLMSRPDLAIHTCTASVTYVIGHPIDTMPRWEPLEVGLTERYATPAQRRALAVRDGGCVHPGCTVRPERCIAHHIRHWRDGGATDLRNLVLLCDFHHRRVHLGRERVTITNGVYATEPVTRGPP